MSFLTSLQWRLGFLFAEQQRRTLLILKTSEPHDHGKSSWMEGISLAEPGPGHGILEFANGCKYRGPCSNLQGK